MNWQLLSKETPQTSEEIVRALLENRGITAEDEVEAFLSPPSFRQSVLSSLQQLFDESQLSEAVELVKQAIKGGSPIVIHGDYDVDGVCATAVLWETLYYDLNHKKALPFIPHRIDHGYGASQESIDSILANPKFDPAIRRVATSNDSGETRNLKEVQPLLITVDCGVTSKGAVTYAKERGFNVIITDHHTKSEDEKDLPPADAILHTTELSGTGVAWVFAQAVLNPKGLEHGGGHKPFADGTGENAKTLDPKGLELVALATIADILPLTGHNRLLVKEGLVHLTDTRRVGLRALKQIARVEGEVNPYHVGWLIAPRLNASGRLDSAMDALRLLCTRDHTRALKIANRLNRLNWQRQQMTKEALAQAEDIVSDEDRIIILASPDWHEGIIGLIAGKLAEKFYRPAIVISQGDEISKASARSVKGVNIIEIIREHEGLLLGAGGHELAAGFSLETEKISRLKDQLTNIKHPTLNVALESGPQLKVDLSLQLEQVSYKLYEAVQKLEPCGFGNPRPVFVSRGVIVDNVRVVGSDKSHLQMEFNSQESGNRIRSIAFGRAPQAAEMGIDIGSTIDIVYTLDKDDYRGGQSVQLKIKDFRES